VRRPIVVAVGTTHPLNIAGLGLALAAAPALDVRGLSIVTGVSAQSAAQVLARTPLDAAIIGAQFDALAPLVPGAFHVGALLGPGVVTAVAAGLARYARVPVVCDPVIAASTGERLADDATVAALRDELFPHTFLLTPNLDEAGVLLETRIGDIAAMHVAARALLRFGSRAVLLKGGHLHGDAIDVLATAEGTREFRGPRVAATLRGTGDLLAAALAASLAHGRALPDAVEDARSFVRERLRTAAPG
jgi:hydroxymethylpyrimidine/phosphomethylpyrimidine kinase